MLILDNIIFSLQRVGGISAVWQHLVEYLVDGKVDVRFLEYASAKDNIFRKSVLIPSDKLILQPYFNSILSQLQHPKITLDEKFIFHSSYFRTCKNPKAINVTTVHDFTYEQSKMSLRHKLRSSLNFGAIRKSEAIVCVSENTKKDLLTYLPEINPNNVHVIYNGVSEIYKPINSIPYTQYSDHILFVGGRQGYKNFDFVVDALSDTRYKLLICGSPLTNKERQLLELRLHDRYTSIHYPSNEELNRIYNSVFALAYPSSYEGFGIPFLEAQRAGCPVIALAASSIPEIAGKNAILMPSLNHHAFAEILNVLNNAHTRFSIVEQGLDNSKRFSWNRMAKEYENLYAELLSH